MLFSSSENAEDLMFVTQSDRYGCIVFVKMSNLGISLDLHSLENRAILYILCIYL